MNAACHLAFALALLGASAAVTVSAGQNLRERALGVAAVDLGFIAALIAAALNSIREVF